MAVVVISFFVTFGQLGCELVDEPRQLNASLRRVIV
jgi:hypothetical protein